MKVVSISKGAFVKIDDKYYEKVTQYRWYLMVGWRGNKYAYTNIGGKTMYLHRFILGSKSKYVDHINNDGLDNRASNLRACDASQNSFNRAPKKTQKYKGIWYRKDTQKWVAQIEKKGHIKRLGCFPTEEEAAKVYDKQAKIWFGDFARLNFPKIGQY